MFSKKYFSNIRSLRQYSDALLSTCFQAGFLLDLFSDPEDEGDMFSETFVDFQRTTRRYIPEDKTFPYLLPLPQNKLSPMTDIKAIIARLYFKANNN
jgi:hypothetical protein